MDDDGAGPQRLRKRKLTQSADGSPVPKRRRTQAHRVKYEQDSEGVAVPGEMPLADALQQRLTADQAWARLHALIAAQDAVGFANLWTHVNDTLGKEFSINQVSSLNGLPTTLLISACAEAASIPLVRFLLSVHASPHVGVPVSPASPFYVEAAATLPLHVACVFGNAQAVKVLLDAGAKVNARGPAGATALHYAASCSEAAVRTQKPYVQCVRALISAGADIDALECRGRTPLMHACAAVAAVIVKLLLSHGANASVSSCGYTALHAVCSGRLKVSHRLSIVDYLVAERVPLDSAEIEGPVELALCWGQRLLALRLLEYGAAMPRAARLAYYGISLRLEYVLGDEPDDGVLPDASAASATSDAEEDDDGAGAGDDDDDLVDDDDDDGGGGGGV